MIDPFKLVEYGTAYADLVNHLEQEGYDTWDPVRDGGMQGTTNANRTFFMWQGYVVYLRENTHKNTVVLRYLDPTDDNYTFVQDALKYFNLA